MLHTIIIPHEQRERRLRLCLSRLARAMSSSRGPAEVLVVSETNVNSSVVPEDVWGIPFDVRFITSPRTGKWFNKPRMQNVGIEEARGEILTFLDVDSLVGCRFYQGAEMALSPRTTKICYRVRPLAEEALEKAESDPEYIDRCFDMYDTFSPARFEAHQLPDLDLRMGDPVFGNSQFSIERRKLGDLRVDESYEGAGCEDIAFNRDIWMHYGEFYQGQLLTSPDFAILDIQNERESWWCTPEQHSKNFNMYRDSSPWSVAPIS